MIESIGTYLKKQREMRKIRLEEVAEATKVHLRSLKALEADELESLPGEVFMRGFVRSYAKSIGLNPDEVTLQLEDYLRVHQNGNHKKKGVTFNAEVGWSPRPILWVVLSCVLILVISYFLG